jgi:glycine cleavage system H protein
MSFPADLLYTLHDEWLRVSGDEATLGITFFAQDALGEIVHVELPEVGATFEAGAAICEVESVKAVAEVYAPVACEILAINEALDGSEELVNSAPYAEGWLVKLKITDASGLAALLDAAAYQAKVASA